MFFEIELLPGTKTVCQILWQPHREHSLLRTGHIVLHPAESHRAGI